MPLEIVTIPCLSDNYAYLVHDAASGDTLASSAYLRILLIGVMLFFSVSKVRQARQ